MTISESTPLPCSSRTTSDDRDHELLERALNEFNTEDQWVNDFIQRLNYAVQALG
jgi:hypothetical protein